MKKTEILKRLFFEYTNKHIKKIFLSVFFSVLVAGSTSSIAYLLDPAIKKIFIEKDQTLIFVIPILIIIAFAAKGISLYLAKILMIGVAEEVRKDLQCDMIGNLINADTKLIDEKHTGKFISSLTNDVGMITNLVSTAVLNLFKDSLTLIGLLTVMFFQNWKLSLISIIMIPLASLAAKTLGKRIGKVATEQMNRAGILQSYLIELFQNHKIIKIFQKEKFEKNRAEKFINDVKEKTKKIAIVHVRTSPIMETLTGFMIAILIYYSGKLIASDELDINNFFSFLAAMMLAYQPVRSLATLNMTIGEGLSAASRILPIIDEESKLTQNVNDTEIQITNGNIEFKNVSFKYDSEERNVLNSINLKMSGGKMTSIVGHSGAGKSTILNLIPRFYDSVSGDICIDNQSVYKSTISSLRKNVSLVSQDTTLFDDTVKNNIAYANLDATDEEIKEAAKYSFANEFIEKLPNKYDTIIGENGTRLSGGEKQRLSIARAMLKKSQIILLDEATSSLDAESEEIVQNAITNLTKNKTTLVIAHRLSTIYNADQIYVLKNGAVLDSGTHDSLLNSSSEYKSLVEKQLK